MRTIVKTLEMVLSGALAVSILHIKTDPTYLELFFGWAGLVMCFVALAELSAAISQAVAIAKTWVRP